FDVDGPICTPDLLACSLVERRDELLFLVVVDDNDKVIDKCGGRGGAELEDSREILERGAPDFIAVEVVGENAKVINIDVDTAAVRHRGFRAKAVLAMAASGRMT